MKAFQRLVPRVAAGCLALGSLMLSSSLAWPADLTIPNTFVPGAPATAADVNKNFKDTADAVNTKQDRVSGTCPAGQAIQSVLPNGTVVCESTLASRLAAAEAMFNYLPVGPQTNVLQARVSVGGWAICYQEPYNTATTATNTVLANCNKTNLMLACLQTGSDTYSVLAQAPRTDVTFNTSTDTTTTHVANGTAWYFNPAVSWGFARAGDAVAKVTCDSGVATNAGQRLCFQMGVNNGNINAGWRCGSNEGLLNASWTRVVLHRD